MKTPDLINKTKYFVHKGTWENEYEWRIQKVKVTGLKVDKDGKIYAEFSFNCCGYEYPVSYLQDTFEAARKFAIKQIGDEKAKQIEKIKSAKEHA